MELNLVTEFEQEKSFGDYLQHVANFAMETFLSDGEHSPVLIVTEGTRTAVYDVAAFYAAGIEGRQALEDALRHRYKGEASWFILVAEAWGASGMRDPAEAARSSPSQDPQRVEIFFVAGVRRDGARGNAAFEVKRDDDGNLTETKPYDASGADFASLWERPLFGGPTSQLGRQARM